MSTPRHARPGRRLRRALAAVAAMAVLVAPPAAAAWLIGSLASPAAARTISVPAVTGVTASTDSDGRATVAWQAAALPPGAGPATYSVLAYPEGGGSARQPGGTCAGSGGLVAGTTCQDASVPEGTWVYRVTAHLASWAGPESDASDAVTVAARDCTTDTPCSVFPGAAPGSASDANDGQPIEVGMKFRSSQAGQVTAIRLFKPSTGTGSYTGHLYSRTGTLLGSTDPTSLSGAGWMELPLTAAVPVNADTTYVTAYYSESGSFAYTAGGTAEDLQAGVSNPPLQALAAGQDGANGVYRYGGGFPTGAPTAPGTNYWADVVFAQGVDTTGPVVTSTVPAADATDVPVSGDVTATFDEPVDPATVTGATYTLTPTAGGPSVPATVSAQQATVRLQPDAELAVGTDYTVRLVGGPGGVADPGGNPLAADYTWSFRTTATSDVTLFDGATPGIADDAADYELGVRFSSAADGLVTGIRFYKGAQNTGQHTGRLWDATTHELLDTVTFTGETASGWQTAAFANPVPIQAGTSYIASYSVPVGYYAAAAQYFTGQSHTSGPLTAPAATETAPNGVFSDTPGAFPTSSFNDTNYFVDVTFQAGADTTAPTVTERSPAPDATGVSTGTQVTGTFSESVQASTVTGSTFTLTAGATAVPATVSSAGSTVTLTPTSPLDADTTYTATLTGGPSGITDRAGNPLAADDTWTFTTEAAAPTQYTIFGNGPGGASAGPDDGQSIEVGTKLRVSETGAVSAVRFYKPFTEGDSFTGRLYDASGTLLGEGTVTLPANATGWQEIPLAAPVALAPGTTYVATYFSPTGRFAATPGGLANAAVTSGPLTALQSGTEGPNGVYQYGGGFPTASAPTPSNYWADVVFEPGAPVQGIAGAAVQPADTLDGTVATAAPGADADTPATGTDTATLSPIGTDTATPAPVGTDPATPATSGTGTATPVTLAPTSSSAELTVAADATSVDADAAPRPLVPRLGDGTGADFRAGTTDGTLVRPDGTGVALDWADTSDHPGSGTFTSRVLDACQASVWGVLALDADTPDGTTLRVEVRTGDTAVPDAGWSEFRPVAEGADPDVPPGRYLQYRLILASTDPRVTPLVRSVRFGGP